MTEPKEMSTAASGEMTDLRLIELADRAREASYSPYSCFSVGAALLCADGRVYTGANIEVSSYTPTICAERVAIFKAVNDGVRDFTAIAISGGPHGDVTYSCSPCGVCRQVMAEFCSPDFRIILKTEDGCAAYTLADLLPLAFGKGDLKK